MTPALTTRRMRSIQASNLIYGQTNNFRSTKSEYFAKEAQTDSSRQLPKVMRMGRTNEKLSHISLRDEGVNPKTMNTEVQTLEDDEQYKNFIDFTFSKRSLLTKKSNTNVTKDAESSVFPTLPITSHRLYNETPDSQRKSPE